MKRGSEGEEREVTEKREEDNEVGSGLVNDPAWRTPPEVGAGGRNWGRTREGGMCSWGRPANVLKLAFVLGNSQYLAPAPSQGEVQGYLVCSPVLTGCCLRLSTPTNWGFRGRWMLKLGSVRSDQSQSSTPDHPTNGGPAAFLREDLGDGSTLFSLFKRFLFLRAYEIGRFLAEIVLQHLDKYKRSGYTFSYSKKQTQSK